MKNGSMARPSRIATVALAAVLGWGGLGGLDAAEPNAGPATAATGVGRDVAACIVGEALTDDRAYRTLAWLCDRIGARLSGSRNLEKAVEWSRAWLEAAGVDRVWTETVMVPHWERGHEAASIVAPVEWEMRLLALGGSVATPEGGVEAEVVEVESLEALDALGREVEGKIVLFNREMEGGFGNPNGYGSVVGMRVDGAARAARHGAVATLLRSLGTSGSRLPHTGMMRYEDGVPKIPSAAISSEDAEMISRLLASGEAVRVRLELGCRTLPGAESANVLAEIVGRERPEEIVLIGAHLDSWDVGHGAHDDGVGVVAVMESMRLLERLGLRPRRTLRAVLFTNEENGLRGGIDYADRHGESRHVVAIEADSGGTEPIGFGVSAGPGGVDRIGALVEPLAAIGATTVYAGGGGADIGPLRAYGTPVMNVANETSRYFDYHHSEADTLDKVDPHDLAKNVAALAWMAWALAESDGILPRLPTEASQD